MTKQKTSGPGWSATGGRKPWLAAALAPGRPWRQLLPAIFLAGTMVLCGCRTATQSLFIATGPAWHVRQGQALWRPKRGLPEFGGDLVLARDDAGNCLIQFDKTPMAILSAQTTSNRWLIKFPQKNWSFSGHGHAPLRFSWLYLPGALAGKPLPKQLRLETKTDGGWRLANSQTGETVEGFLSP